MAWNVTESKYVFSNEFVKLREDTCLLPNSVKTGFYTVEMRDWAMAIALTPDKKVVLVEQYRHPTGQELIEFPAGVTKKGEDAAETIRREFLEETGYELTKLEKIGAWYIASRRSNCQATVFFGLISGKKGKQKLDKTENIKVILKSAKEIVKMIMENKIKIAAHIAGFLAAKEKYPEYFV